MADYSTFAEEYNYIFEEHYDTLKYLNSTLKSLIFKGQIDRENKIVNQAYYHYLRCKNQDELSKEPDFVESFLRYVYLDNSNISQLSLPEIVAIRKKCELFWEKIEKRILNKKEYKKIDSIARESEFFNENERYENEKEKFKEKYCEAVRKLI